MIRKLLLLLILISTLIPVHTLKAQVSDKNLINKDTLNVSRDSLVRIILIKDSILLRNRYDSIKLSDQVVMLEFKRDSLLAALTQTIYMQKLDSANRMRHYLNRRDFNRRSRQDLYTPIGDIDEDSVRSSLKQIIDLVYQDTSYVPKQQVLKSTMDRLVFHLANDSTFFRIVNAKQDTVPFVLKKNRIDSAAFFVMNSKSDSAKLYVRSLNKNTMFMWVGDDLWLKKLLKKQGPPEALSVRWMDPNKLRIAHRDVPAPPPVYWTGKANLSIMANQLALANWAKGGSSNISFTSYLNASAHYEKGNIKWDNTLYCVYGVQKSELTNLGKNQDQIKLVSNLSHKAFKHFDYTLGLTMLTQGFKGYASPNDSIPVSAFFAPADLTLSLGMTYKPGPKLTLIMSPIAGKMTFVLDTALIDQTRYGLKPDKRMMAQLGATVTIAYSTTILKNVTMDNGLTLFSNYINHPEKVNFDWKLDFNLKVNRYLTTSIKINLLYDNMVMVPIYEVTDGVKVKVGEGKRVQFSEALGVSFKYYIF